MSTATITEVIETTMIDGTRILTSRFTVDMSPADYEKKLIASGIEHVLYADESDHQRFQWLDKETEKPIMASFRSLALPITDPAPSVILAIETNLDS